MHRALFVAHQHVAQPGLLVEGVVDRQDRPAGIAEQDLHALVDERAHDDLRAGPGSGLGGRLGERLVQGHGIGLGFGQQLGFGQ